MNIVVTQGWINNDQNDKIFSMTSLPQKDVGQESNQKCLATLNI